MQMENWRVLTEEINSANAINRRINVSTPGGHLDHVFNFFESTDRTRTHRNALNKKPMKSAKNLNMFS
jgi:hypothetical protein